MAILPPSSLMPDSVWRNWPMSTMSDGLAKRSFMAGSRVWPPAISLASPFLASSVAASATVDGRW